MDKFGGFKMIFATIIIILNADHSFPSFPTP